MFFLLPSYIYIYSGVSDVIVTVLINGHSRSAVVSWGVASRFVQNIS